jgi:immune inhibitor A
LDSEPGVPGLRYGYAALDLERPAVAVYEHYPVTVKSSVQQFGADYIVLRGNDDLHIQFTGAITIPLLDVSPHSGHSFWWSNRTDESLTTLTRLFDLSGISSGDPVTLTYWTWYDIEQGYDYATLEVSTDGGGQWQILSPPAGTGANPHGNNPGWGYTGRSGDPPGWVQETVDLSPYAGNKVLVRFAYLTDEAVTGTGFALDDVSIPKIGYADGVEGGESGWEPAGFVRSDHLVPQRYLALLIRLGQEGTGKVSVERLPVEENALAEWTVPLGSEGGREAVIVFSGLTPLTPHPALYQLRIE